MSYLLPFLVYTAVSYLLPTQYHFLLPELYPKLHYTSPRISYMLKYRTVLSYFTSPFHLAASRQMPLGLFCLTENDPLHLTLAFIPSSSIEEFYFCSTAIIAFNVNISHGYLLLARKTLVIS